MVEKGELTTKKRGNSIELLLTECYSNFRVKILLYRLLKKSSSVLFDIRNVELLSFDASKLWWAAFMSKYDMVALE